MRVNPLATVWLSAALFSSAFGLSACQSTPPTASPLAAMPPLQYAFDASKAEVKQAALAVLLPRGHMVVRDTDLTLVTEKPDPSFAASFAFGTRFNSVPNARLTLTLVGDKPVTVHVGMQYVANPGSGYERAVDMSQNPQLRGQLGEIMTQIKASLAALPG